MRVFLVIMALATGVAFAAPASAGVVSDVATGVNGAVTAPADVVLGLTEGHRVVDLGPANFVTDRLAGLIQGLFVGVNRAVRGVLDVGCAFLPVGPVGPPPRFSIVPGADPVPSPDNS